MCKRIYFPVSRQIIVAALCLCLTTSIFVVPGHAAPPLRTPAIQTPGNSQDSPSRDNFKFEKADLDLLEQVNLLDARFEREGLVLSDEATNALLRHVGESLLPRGSKLENVSWKFRALRDSVPNAFALPNGSIYVSTGLLARMDNESQLAAVLADEMTHVTRRHSYLQNRSNRKKILAINIINAVGAYAPGGAVGAVITIVTAV